MSIFRQMGSVICPPTRFNRHCDGLMTFAVAPWELYLFMVCSSWVSLYNSGDTTESTSGRLGGIDRRDNCIEST